MNQPALAVAEKVAQRFSQLADVQAVALAGSHMSGAASAGSDIDLYIYSTHDISASVRTGIGAEFSDDVELNDFWGSGNEWTDRETGIHVDAMFWTTGWITDQIDRVLLRHEASMGYSTCFWHTIRISQILFDRTGWLAHLQMRAMQEYPEALVKAIIANNYPVLRKISSSYLKQIEKAASRDDRVSVNHRTAALLASYFDILFAINHVPHPGEKRLVDLAEKLCATRPVAMRSEINAIIEASAGEPAEIAVAINRLVDSLDDLLQSGDI